MRSKSGKSFVSEWLSFVSYERVQVLPVLYQVGNVVGGDIFFCEIGEFIRWLVSPNKFHFTL